MSHVTYEGVMSHITGGGYLQEVMEPKTFEARPEDDDVHEAAGL